MKSIKRCDLSENLKIKAQQPESPKAKENLDGYCKISPDSRTTIEVISNKLKRTSQGYSEKTKAQLELIKRLIKEQKELGMRKIGKVEKKSKDRENESDSESFDESMQYIEQYLRYQKESI
ncbi:hypothetical protein SSS_02214 [Sarcoptes scabiei]|uniref:Uncharacterized protein n=1 Tax=Sarcoptes scabiei TaxID=52283 RepID=A0A834VGV4_SARSC|nr:hypothetical protein SSS_02214 [Sarcoptes scabiei]